MIFYITGCVVSCLPRVMDFEHFMLSFLARRSNQVPSLWPPVAREENVFDFWRVLISIVDILLLVLLFLLLQLLLLLNCLLQLL